MKFHNYTQVAIQTALQCGELLKKGFGKKMQISSKSNIQDLVTEYDQKSEKAAIDQIHRHFPDHVFLGEESGYSQKHSEAPIWIIDPLDGTVNFAHGVPIFSVSIALAVDGELFCGVVYHPMMDELFVAEKGKGAYLGNIKLTLAPKPFEKSLLVTGFPSYIDTNPMGCVDQLSYMLKLGVPIRRLGSAAIDLAYVAAGRFDSFFEVVLCPWDVAAGTLLVQEAGGIVTDYQGNPRPLLSNVSTLAANPAIHQTMITHLGKALII